MTATEGGTALHGPGAAGGSRVTTQSRALRLRMVLSLAKVEAWLLFRSMLVLAGLLAGGLVIWLVIHPVEPVWWNASWEIGYGQLLLGMAVLIAAQLAAGRPRRDAMGDLYASFPATAATRTVAHLTGLAGTMPASLLLIGGTAVAVEMLAPIGAPSVAATKRGARARGLLASAGILAAAAICVAGAEQLRPIPATELNRLVAEAADPAAAQHCTTVGQVRYCLYPGFGPELPAIQAPVSAVLAHLPARLAQPLTVRQAAPVFPDPTLTHGHPKQQVTQWNAQLQNAPGYGAAAPASAVYLTAGSWPGDTQAAEARFGLALATAEWAVHLPPATPAATHGMQCVPLDQAREAIAIWLAIQATRPSAGELQSGLIGPDGGHVGVMVRGVITLTWNYPSVGMQALASVGTQTTDAGYLLASAMSRLPERKVSHVLHTAWPRWVNWHTTDAQLAAELGIPMPAVPQPLSPRPGMTIVSAPGNPPQNPVCTT